MFTEYAVFCKSTWSCIAANYTEYSGAAMSKGQDRLQAYRILKSSAGKCYAVLEYFHFRKKIPNP